MAAACLRLLSLLCFMAMPWPGLLPVARRRVSMSTTTTTRLGFLPLFFLPTSDTRHQTARQIQGSEGDVPGQAHTGSLKMISSYARIEGAGGSSSGSSSSLAGAGVSSVAATENEQRIPYRTNLTGIHTLARCGFHSIRYMTPRRSPAHSHTARLSSLEPLSHAQPPPFSPSPPSSSSQGTQSPPSTPARPCSM